MCINCITSYEWYRHFIQCSKNYKTTTYCPRIQCALEKRFIEFAMCCAKSSD